MDFPQSTLLDSHAPPCCDKSWPCVGLKQMPGLKQKLISIDKAIQQSDQNSKSL